MNYPSTFRYSGGQLELQDGTSPSQPIWGMGPQRDYYDNPAWQWTKFFAGFGTVVGAGFLPAGQGNKRVWDYYLKGIRFAEERSPGQIFRTFQLSTFLSPLEASSRINRFYSGGQLTEWLGPRGGALGTHYERLFNLTGNAELQSQIMQQGITFAGNKVHLGEGASGKVLLEHAQVMQAPFGSVRGMESWSRAALGVTPTSTGAGWFTRGKIPVLSEYTSEGVRFQDQSLIVGGASRGQAYWRQTQAVAADVTQRFNKLLWGMTDWAEQNVPGVKKLVNMAPASWGPIGLGVERAFVPGTKRIFDTSTGAAKTWGKYALKFGIGLPAVVGAWQTLDWATRELGTEGINAAIGKGIMYSKMAVSGLAEITSGHALREWQEEAAPGSTSLTKLAAFPLTGALAGATIGYLHKQRVYHQVGRKFKERLANFQAAGDVTRAARLEASTGRLLAQRASQVLGRKEYQGWAMRHVMDFLEKNEFLTIGKGKGIGEWLRGKSPARLRTLIGAAIGTAAVLPFIPGALVPGERPEEIHRLMTGEQDVPVRRGRWWPAGRSPHEGERIMQWRPHWSALVRKKPQEIGVWGEDPVSPLSQWFLKNFTYHLEEKHYHDRPYAVSGPAFADTPIIGPILSGTVGRVIKPTRFYHTEEWVRRTPEGGGLGGAIAQGDIMTDYQTLWPAPKTSPPDLSLGGLPFGNLRPPGGIKDILGETAYRMQEIVGLPGFIAESIKERVTGRPGWWDEEARLRTAGAMYGAEESAAWQMQFGDPFFVTEWARRLYPHRQRQIPLIEPPIRNQMPDWMPGTGDRSADFLTGDPFTKVPIGEALLPGPGFEALHPELKGVAPEDYPLFWRYHVLAHVAPYSERYKEHERQMRAASQGGQLTAEQDEAFKRIQAQVQEQKRGITFFKRQFTESGADNAREAILQANQRARRGESPGIFGKLLGSYWETIGLNLETPLEALTPLAPASKYLHMRTDIQAYERERIYGRKMAMWGHPYEHFVKPFFQQVFHGLGWDGIPSNVKETRRITELFDILEYLKYTRLKEKSFSQGDYERAKEYEDARRATMTGVNVMGRNYSQIFRALPRDERDYFRSFTEATTDEAKEEILSLVPEAQKPMLIGQWKLAYMDTLRKAIKNETITEFMTEAEAEKEIEKITDMQNSEGFPMSEELIEEFLATRLPGEPYADWFRRKKIAERIEELGFSVPGPDWVGMHPNVDLEDVKMKYVLEEGLNAHDFDLWPDRMMTLPYKPYIDTEALEAFQGKIDKEEAAMRIRTLLKEYQVSSADVMISPAHGSNKVQVNVLSDSEEALHNSRRELRDML